jgi:macrolide transport system ATP-binding/permease protein
LKEEPTLQGYRKSRLRNLFVVAQVAISFVLLIGAGLFIKSLLQARTNSVGFQPQNVLIASIDVGLGGYDQNRGTIFYQQLIPRIEALPGVRSASLAKAVPLDVGATQQIGVVIEGLATPRNTNMPVDYNVVTPRYFETLGIPLLEGRDFSQGDSLGSPGVVIVNEALAQRFWPGQHALGKRLAVSGGKGRMLEVVGLAKNSKYYGLREDPRPFIYLPFLQAYRSGMTLHVNSADDPRSLLNSVRQQVQQLDQGVPIFNVKTMTEHLGVALFELRAAAVLLSVFGLLALFLATSGLYGMMAYSVNQRKKEIGIRMALGAQRSDILKLIIREGMLLTLLGLIIGLAVAAGLTRLLSTLLYGVNAIDLSTYAIVTLLLAGVAFLSSLLPAREATKVDPIRALRYE